MRKCLVILIYMLAIVNCFGQINKLDGGFEGGLNLSSIRGNTANDENNKSRIGYSIGAFIQYNTAENFSIRSGIYNESKGCAFDLVMYNVKSGRPENVRGIDKFQYVVIPLLFRLNFGKKFNYFINAGPYIGFLLKETEVIKIENYPNVNNDFTSKFKNNEAGLSSGIGFSYNYNQKAVISFEVRDNLGLTNVINKPDGDASMKTNAFNFLFAVSYKLGKK